MNKKRRLIFILLKSLVIIITFAAVGFCDPSTGLRAGQYGLAVRYLDEKNWVLTTYKSKDELMQALEALPNLNHIEVCGYDLKEIELEKGCINVIVTKEVWRVKSNE